MFDVFDTSQWVVVEYRVSIFAVLWLFVLNFTSYS